MTRPSTTERNKVRRQQKVYGRKHKSQPNSSAASDAVVAVPSNKKKIRTRASAKINGAYFKASKCWTVALARSTNLSMIVVR